jgi:hypothetical protein
MDAECQRPGQRDDQPCGLCGMQTRNCGPDRFWGDFGTCVGEGECAPGDVEGEACGASDRGECSLGRRDRTCSGACRWNDWGDCLGDVGPTAEICGDALDQDCNGVADRRPDGYEPNDTCGRCTPLGEDPNVFANPTMDSVDDTWDYFCFTANDNGLNPLEDIEVRLEDIPNGNDYDVFLFRSQAACVAGDRLAASANAGSDDEYLRYGEAAFSDDAGEYVVGVKRWVGQSCNATYTLRVDGLN